MKEFWKYAAPRALRNSGWRHSYQCLRSWNSLSVGVDGVKAEGLHQRADRGSYAPGATMVSPD